MAAFAYYDADTDGTVYYVLPNLDHEYAPSSFGTETDTTVSATTIHSDDLREYFVLHHGRLQPANEKVFKWFPPDNIGRLVAMYLIFRLIFGGNYLGPVREVLSPIEGRKRHVLELGTRVGTWTQAMATEFPDVQFRSLDIVPVTPHIPRQNVIFEVYDFVDKIQLEDESQDAVFLNLVAEVVKDFRALLREVYRVLRPGGLIHISDIAPGAWDPEDPTILARRTAPIITSLSDIIRKQLSSIGIDPDTCKKLPQWLASDSDIWSKGQNGFKDVHSQTRVFPLLPHDGHSCIDLINPSMIPYARHVGITSTRDMVGLLKDSGLTEQQAQRLINDVLEEAEHPESCSLFKACRTYGIKV